MIRTSKFFKYGQHQHTYLFGIFGSVLLFVQPHKRNTYGAEEAEVFLILDDVL